VDRTAFPQDIYEIDISEKEEAVIRRFRKRIEEF